MSKNIKIGVGIIFVITVISFVFVFMEGRSESSRSRLSERSDKDVSVPKNEKPFAGKGFVVDGDDVRWHSDEERKSIEVPLLLKKSPENDQELARMRAWEVGEDADGNTFILVAYDSLSRDGILTFLFLRKIYQEDISYTFYTKYSSYDFFDQFSEANINDDVVSTAYQFERVYSLEYPGYISFNGAIFKIQRPYIYSFDVLFFDPKNSERNLELISTDSIFGPVFSGWDEEIIHFRSPYGTEMVYKLIPNFFRGDIPNISWNDGASNSDSFRKYIDGGGCGGSVENGAEDMPSFGDIIPTGKTKHGDMIYELKDKNDEFLKKWYQENINWLNSFEPEDYSNEFFNKKTTYAEFVKNHLVFFWKNPLGDFMPFVNENYIFGGGCGKPVIYLYPEKTEKISCRVEPNGGMTISIPEHHDGWEVIASPDGTLKNISDGKSYPYLFWEGDAHSQYNVNESGFVVEKENLEEFLDETLIKLGLNAKESFDFKEFWLPRMLREDKPYYFVTFFPQSVIDTMAPLHITPKPDTIIRVLMKYEGLDEKREVKKLEIVTPERNGFVAVEWGGSLR